jgi:adenylate kinase
MKTKIILLGPPGAGKGTLAGKIKDIIDIAHISTGDILRENVKNETEIGLQAKEYMDAGALVPDEIVIEMVKERLAQPDCEQGFMFDGFPRTEPQAEALEQITNIELILELQVPFEILAQRILGRISCSKCGAVYNIYDNPPQEEGVCDKCGTEMVQRSDDTEETLKKRLDAFTENAQPILEFYEGKADHKVVDGTHTLELTEDDVRELLE